jgi:excinuclease ABC subunit A
VIKAADWVIDLGPEGGDKGGDLVAAGTPEQIARNAASHTGRYLRRVLDLGRPSGAAPKRRQRAAAAVAG